MSNRLSKAIDQGYQPVRRAKTLKCEKLATILRPFAYFIQGELRRRWSVLTGHAVRWPPTLLNKGHERVPARLARKYTLRDGKKAELLPLTLPQFK